MEVIMTKVWDEVFFEEFASFKNLIHKDIETSFPETYSDYAKYFSPSSPFMEDFSWRAFKIMQNGAIVAQAILCWRNGSTVGNLGFIDWKNDQAAAKLLVSSVEAAAHATNLKSIKTPVDLTFFLKYRIRLEGGQKPFYGEPVYPAYYHELFKHCDFEVVGKWDTYQLNTLAAIKDFFKKRMMLEKRKDVSQPKARNKNLQTKIRSIKGSDWDNELRIIYQLFNEAYKDMPEYEPVSFEQFKIIYDDFKYIMNPLMSYIVELQGKPVGFSIN